MIEYLYPVELQIQSNMLITKFLTEMPEQENLTLILNNFTDQFDPHVPPHI